MAWYHWSWFIAPFQDPGVNIASWCQDVNTDQRRGDGSWWPSNLPEPWWLLCWYHRSKFYHCHSLFLSRSTQSMLVRPGRSVFLVFNFFFSCIPTVHDWQVIWWHWAPCCALWLNLAEAFLWKPEELKSQVRRLRWSQRQCSCRTSAVQLCKLKLCQHFFFLMFFTNAIQCLLLSRIPMLCFISQWKRPKAWVFVTSSSFHIYSLFHVTLAPSYKWT